METLSQLIGLTASELIQLVILAVILLIGLFLLRMVFKLTATMLRIGCFGIILIVAAVYFISLLNH